MRCDQCKHWSTEERFLEVDRRSGLKKCKAIRFGDDVSSEAIKGLEYPEVDDKKYWVEHENRIVEALKKERACMDDGDIYNANFYSAPDFFCAKFEQK